jgi:limonene-1,2-epoxide hydrolase
MTDTDAANEELVREFWQRLGRRDFAGCGAMMAPQGHYVDVAVANSDPGAFGPDETTARLQLGLGKLLRYELHDGPIVASQGYVVTEHSETWTWEEGVTATLPFTSVMEISDGKITRWWDYFNLATILDAAPAWWLEHIMAQSYK